jgi:hypothetical protein
MITTWKPAKLDLALSAVLALLFPFVAGLLFTRTGALLPIALYYGIAWGVVKWRRGSIGYRNPFPAKPPIAFYVNIGVILACLTCAWLTPIVVPTVSIPGMLITALVWAPLNGATEQILWIYIFESWDLYPKKINIANRLIGLLFFTAFVGLIHIKFWVLFLTTVEPGSVIGIVFVMLTSISGYLHLIVWRKSRQMIFTFIPHLLLNLVPVIWTHYSILPYLIR